MSARAPDPARLAALRAGRRHHGPGWFRNNYNTDRHGIAEFMRWMREKRGLWPSPKHEDKIAKLAKRNGKKPVQA